jgi:hypothetical protein
LMSKYGLSARQFDSAMRKLNEAGFLTGHQVPRPTDAALGTQTPSRCPACAAPLAKGLDECPKCGVIFAKYHIVEEPPPKDTSDRIPLPDLLKGEAVTVGQRSPLVWIGALTGFAIIVAAAAFLFFRPSLEAPQSIRKGPEVAVTAPAEPPSTPEPRSELTETSEEHGVESRAAAPGETTTNRGSEDNRSGTAEATSETAIAIPTGESTLAEDEAAVPAPENRAEQSNVDMKKTLDLLSQSMVRDFDRAVRQWTSDDFKRFATRAGQTLDEVSTEGLPDEIRQTGENLILQLRLESPENAAEAFRQLAALVRPELDGLSQESKTKFIKSAQEIKRDIETSITR